jgi:hypothetical protein
VSKGFRETLKGICAASNMSMNQFVNNAIDLYIEKLINDKVLDERTVTELYSS